MTIEARRRLAFVLLTALLGCGTTRQVEPSKLREADLRLPPLYWSESSPDGTSSAWWALFGLVGADVEGDRRHSRALPFWWTLDDAPYRSSTLVFPFYYERESAVDRARFYSFLYGTETSEHVETTHVLFPFGSYARGIDHDYWHSTLFPLWDWRHEDETDDVTLLPLLGLAHLARLELGRPAEGVRVPALGRDASRRLEFVNVLNAVEVFGYDDVGDRREVRVLTLLGSEVLSPIRSWRGRADDDPFVHEWVFPLYMNVHDERGDGFSYVGPLWGEVTDVETGSRTDWWLLGLLARTRDDDGTTWRVLGLPLP